MGADRVEGERAPAPGPSASPATGGPTVAPPTAALLALQRRAGNSAVVRMVGPATVQRVVLELTDPDDPESGSLWVSEHDPFQTFDDQSEARKHDLALMREKRRQEAWKKPPAGLRNLDDKMKAGILPPVPKARTVGKAVDTAYPDRAREHMTAEASALLGGRERGGLSHVKQPLIEHEKRRGEARMTVEGRQMQDEPTLNMVDAGISMNHKVADSSVAVICAEISATLRKQGGKPTKVQYAALSKFVRAMSGGEEGLRLLISAADPSGPARANSALRIGIEKISNGMFNLRFGNAKLNTRILYGFDPNLNSDGSRTPLTEEINRTVRALLDVGLVNEEVVDASLEQAEVRSTGVPLSSSTARGPGGGTAPGSSSSSLPPAKGRKAPAPPVGDGAGAPRPDKVGLPKMATPITLPAPPGTDASSSTGGRTTRSKGLPSAPGALPVPAPTTAGGLRPTATTPWVPTPPYATLSSHQQTGGAPLDTPPWQSPRGRAKRAGKLTAKPTSSPPR